MDLKRIIIFRIGHLGDTVVSLPAFWAVRRAFENAELTLLTNFDRNNPEYVAAQSVLPARGLFDKWLSFPSGVRKRGSAGAFLKLLSQLRRGKYDAVVYLMTRNRTKSQIQRDLLIFRLGGIKKIFGVEYLKDNLIDPDEQNPGPVRETEAEFLLSCLSEDVDFPAVQPIDLSSELLLTEAEKNKATKWLEENCGEFYESGRFFGVAPASKWSSKVWMEERFTTVVRELIDEKNMFPVVFGGPEDAELGQRLVKNWSSGAVAAGQLNIREAAAALQHCVFYLGNDTGTMHLSAAVGTPCVTVFAAIDRAGRWEPFGDKNVSFRRKVECESCYAPVCFNNQKCLDLISAEEVTAACLELLEKK